MSDDPALNLEAAQLVDHSMLFHLGTLVPSKYMLLDNVSQIYALHNNSSQLWTKPASPWKGSREKFQKLTTLDFTILSTYHAVCFQRTSTDIMNLILYVSHDRKPETTWLFLTSWFFFFFLMLCVSSCFSPNSPLSLNCSIIYTLTSRICDLSSAKPLFLKSLL